MNPLAWLFLYYKALCLNDSYRSFCTAMSNSDMRQVESLSKENHFLFTFFKLFGDLSANYNNVKEQEHFSKWLKLHGKNFIPARYKWFELVNAGESIVPQEGVVYYTLPADASKDAARLFYSDLLVESVKEIDKHTEDRFLPLTQLEWNSRGRLDSIRKKLDIYFWAFYDVKYNGVNEPNNRGLIYLAADSYKDHWKPLRSQLVQLCNSATPVNDPPLAAIEDLTHKELATLQSSFSKDKAKSKAIVENAAKGYFPSPKSQSKIADNFLQGFDKNNIEDLFD